MARSRLHQKWRKNNLEHGFTTILRAGLSFMNLPADDFTVEQMKQYAQFLKERNQVMNLTAITEPDQMARLHFLDSLELLKVTSLRGKQVIDVGTGAGFPGLPLKLVEPSIHLTLLDSQRKRVTFLEEVVGMLKLEGVSCIQARAEEQSRLEDWRECFDCAVSRAVAELRILVELCLPFVKVGGFFLAMKSLHCEEEIEHARNAIEAMGGVMEAPHVYTLPDTATRRQILVIHKKKETPKRFPRRFAKMQKERL